MIYLDQERSSLYFDRYAWSGHFHIKHVNLIRAFDEKIMRHTVEQRTIWGSWRSWSAHSRPSDQQLAELADLIEPLSVMRSHSKLMFYSHWLYVYTNDVNTLNIISQWPQVVHTTIHQARVTKPRDIVFLKEPRQPYRSYLRAGWLEYEQHQTLLRFLDTRPDQYYVTPGFKKRLQEAKSRMYLQDHVFVEHSSMQDLTLLALAVPGCIKRTVSVQAK